MNTKTLIKRLSFSDEALERIKSAIQKAESRTIGEIAVVVAPESDDYSFWEFAFSFAASIFVFFCALPFANDVRGLYEKLFWTYSEWYLPAFYGVSFAFLVLLIFWLSNFPAIDRLIIPKHFRTVKVNHMAFRVFSECGVYCTKEHTGILIFVSFLEREVRIIADKGISEKISSDLWNIITDSISSELSKKNYEGTFVDAIEKCGELLAENFPSRKKAENELSDGLIIFER